MLPETAGQESWRLRGVAVTALAPAAGTTRAHIIPADLAAARSAGPAHAAMNSWSGILAVARVAVTALVLAAGTTRAQVIPADPAASRAALARRPGPALGLSCPVLARRAVLQPPWPLRLSEPARREGRRDSLIIRCTGCRPGGMAASGPPRPGPAALRPARSPGAAACSGLAALGGASGLAALGNPRHGGSRAGRKRPGIGARLLDDRALLHLDLEIEQAADRFFLDARHHLAEHVEALALVFHQRVALRPRPQADAVTQVVHLVQVLTPLAVQHRQDHAALKLPHHLRRQFRFAAVVRGLRVLEHLPPLVIDVVALAVHHVVVLEQVLADLEVLLLDLGLRGPDRAADRLRLDRHFRRRLQPFHEVRDLVRVEHPHQVVFERQVEPRLARVTLPPGPAAELIVDPA